MKPLTILLAIAVLVVLLYGASQWVFDDAAHDGRSADADPSLLAGKESATDDEGPKLAGLPGEVIEGSTPTDDDAQKPIDVTPTRKSKPQTLADQWKALGFEATTPPTSLEGMLLDGTTPITEGEGLLWKIGAVTTAGAIPAGKPPTRTVKFSEDGVFRFDELEDGAWMLGVKLDDGVQRLFYLRHGTGKTRNNRLLMVLGKGEVFGFVYEADGQPAANAAVRVGPQGQTDFIAQTQTDVNGRYRIGRLRGGPGSVSVALRGDLDDDKQTAFRFITIPQDGSIEVSFGSPRGDPSIAGVVQCRDGEPVRGPGRVTLGDDERGGFVSVDYDENGRFDQRIAAGSYRVKIWLPSGGTVATSRLKEPFVVRHDQRDVTWTLRGTRVQGRVRTSNGAALKGKENYVSVLGHEKEFNPFDGGRQYARIRADGTYVAYGLGPGPCAISTQLPGFEEQKTTLDIAEGVPVVRQEFTVTPKAQKKLRLQESQN